MQQSAAALGDEEVRPAARSEVSIAPFGVAAESRADRRMQGHEARLAKLGLSNRQNAVIQVDVVSLKTDCFGQTQPRHRNQPKQVMIGPSTESGRWPRLPPPSRLRDPSAAQTMPSWRRAASSLASVGRVLLGGEQDEGVGPHHLLERKDRLLASDEEGHDHVGKYDDVAQRQSRMGSGFTWRKRWAWLCSGHGPKSI